MSRKKIFFLILLSFELAIIIPLAIAMIPRTKSVRHISINAEKFKYSPSKIIVNKGDTIVLRFSSKDVTHGFYLDGYPIELMARKGTSFKKNLSVQTPIFSSGHSLEHLDTNWSQISSVKFTASTSGKFVFRCTKICGNLHPFMTGELIVKPNTSYHFAVSFSIWITFFVLILIFHEKEPSKPKFKRINILQVFPWLDKLIKRQGFQFVFILPNFLIFYLFILSSLGGSPVGNRNISIVFVWILWWFVLKAILVPFGGRVWCFVCPLPAPAEWLSRKRIISVKFIPQRFRGLYHRFTGLERDWPQKLQNIWLQNLLFLAMISFGMILITRPIATAILFLVILGVTLLLSLIFRQRVFCRYLCPVGGFLGTYSMAAMTEIRSIDKDICKKHKNKSCFSGGEKGWACPWNQYIGNMDRNNDCGLCTECIKNCPKDNIGIFIRPFGSDKNIKGYDEMYNIMIMLVVAMVFSAVMLGPWGFIKDAANVTESREIIPFIVFVAIVWSLALVIFPGLFVLCAKISNYLAGKPVSDRTLTLRLAYILIPIGMFAWIAFSLPAIMINYGYIISILSDPLGLGWDLFNMANVHFKPFIPHWIPFIQGVILLSGLYLGLSRGYDTIKEVIIDRSLQCKAMIFPSLFSLFCVNILLKIYMG
jgi:ferredoxin/plastocyanin